LKVKRLALKLYTLKGVKLKGYRNPGYPVIQGDCNLGSWAAPWQSGLQVLYKIKEI